MIINVKTVVGETLPGYLFISVGFHLEFFVFMFRRILICSFLVMSLSGFGIRIMLDSWNELRSISPLQFSGEVCVELVLFIPKVFSRIHQ